MGIKRFVGTVFIFLSLPLLAQTPEKDLDFWTIKDPASGLSWVTDGNFWVKSGLTNSVVMPRGKALKLIVAMNRGLIQNFGHSDWRLANQSELAKILSYQERLGLPWFESPQLKQGGSQLPKILGLAPGSGTASDQDATLAIPVRGGNAARISGTVILASNSIFLKNGVTVHSGNVIANNVATGDVLATNSEVTIGVRVSTPAGYNVMGDTITVQNRATVNGDAYFNELSGNGDIFGDLFTPLALPVFETLPPFFGFNQNDGQKPVDIMVGNGQTLTIDQGLYGHIMVMKGGELRFSGGRFDVMGNIYGENDSRFAFEGDGRVHVQGHVFTTKDSYIGPAEGAASTASGIVWYCSAINGTDGALESEPRAVEIGLGSTVIANIYAPNGTIRLKQNTDNTGAFIGRDIMVDNNAQLTLESTFVNEEPVAVSETATVITGGTVSVFDSGETSVLANDTDPNGDTLTVNTTPLSGPQSGLLVLNPDGTFAYTHDGSSTTTDSFDYEVCDDGSPQLCASATVFISIVPDLITVNVSKTGLGSGVVTSTPGGINCGPDCSSAFGTNQLIFLEANADEGSVFGGWSGDPDCIEGVLVPNGDKDCIATFNELPPPPPDDITVTVNLAGDGSGVVKSTPEGIDCGETCSAAFQQFSRISLEPTPDPGSVFAGWSGDLDCLDGLLNGDVDKNCTATFTLDTPPPNSFTLRVVVQGGGRGTVSSSPSGIFCSTDCSADFEENTNVSLSIRPDGDSTFLNWSGDCSGTSFFTNVVLDADKTCFANIVSN